MTVQRVDGLRTILRNTELVRMKNTTLWQEDCRKLRERLRGNGWTVFKRLVYDYRNQLGNRQRSKQQQLPYVDDFGYLYTSPALITYVEAKAMSNRTVSRWIDRLQVEFDLDGEFFILDYKAIHRDCIRLKLNPTFFILCDENSEKQKKQSSTSQKPPEKEEGHIDVLKLAKKFNRKHHNR